MLLLVVLLAVAIVVGVAADPQFLVQTPLGPVQGAYGGGLQPTRAFLGIPFATPPIGNLRFRPAQPAKPWY